MNIADIYEGHYLPEKTKKRRASTVAGYDSSIRLHVLPRWGACEIDEIDPDDVQEWVDSFERPGAAIKAYKCLRQIIRWWAKSKRLRIADPTVYVELPSMEPYRPDTLDSGEATEMLRGMWGHVQEAVAICSVTLGLRRGEACALTWSDINLKTGEVRVSKSRQCVNGEVVTEGTKTDKSTRSCWLPRFAVNRLRKIKGKGLITGDVSPDKVARSIKSHCKRHGLPHVSMTNLRHTWATLAVEAGVGIETVAMMLGHADISTAYDHYIVPRRTICQDAQAAVEALLVCSANRPRRDLLAA